MRDGSVRCVSRTPFAAIAKAESKGGAPDVATGIETAIAGTVVKITLERVAPAGLARVKSIFRGKTLMVVGPARSGKTTFVRYLQYGIFQHAGESEPTYDPVQSPRFNLKLGADRTLEVSIKSAHDLPGDYPARQLADEAFEKRPHSLVIVLDLSAPLNGADEASSDKWLKEFLTRLDQRWQGQKAKQNRLLTVVVAMNKMDAVDASVVPTHEARFREIIAENFKAARGAKTDEVLFKRSTMVENPGGTRWLDAILVALATSVTRKR